MAIQLDDAMFQQLLDATLGSARIEPREARAVIAIAELTAAVDLDETPAETTLLGAFADRLCERARIELATIRPLTEIPTDEQERLEALAERARLLVTRGARELAYAAAYLVVVADLELEPLETQFLEDIRVTLDIDPRRAAELAELAAQIVTFPRTDHAPAPLA